MDATFWDDNTKLHGIQYGTQNLTINLHSLESILSYTDIQSIYATDLELNAILQEVNQETMDKCYSDLHDDPVTTCMDELPHYTVLIRHLNPIRYWCVLCFCAHSWRILHWGFMTLLDEQWNLAKRHFWNILLLWISLLHFYLYLYLFSWYKCFQYHCSHATTS